MSKKTRIKSGIFAIGVCAAAIAFGANTLPASAATTSQKSGICTMHTGRATKPYEYDSQIEAFASFKRKNGRVYLSEFTFNGDSGGGRPQLDLVTAVVKDKNGTLLAQKSWKNTKSTSDPYDPWRPSRASSKNGIWVQVTAHDTNDNIAKAKRKDKTCAVNLYSYK